MNSSFNFLPFYEQYKKIYPNNSLPTIDFLQWFIGFTEGDGCFSIAKRGDLSFVISQSSSDIQILNYIKDNLQFGEIILQSKKQKIHRYIIQNIESLILISYLFNGNMVLPTRNTKFIIFLSYLNDKILKKNKYQIIIPSYNFVSPSLNDYWICGFSDAESCFNVVLNNKSNKFQIRFILAQKWIINKTILDKILNLFSKSSIKPIGAVKEHSVDNVWVLRIQGLKNCQFLFDYFDNFILKTKKLEAYKDWKYLHSSFEKKDHLYLEKRIKLIAISKKLNK